MSNIIDNKAIHSVQGEKIVIQGAREHNLKNISVEIPRNKLVVISGLSGSGKSSLAFDTLFAEGQRRYMESLSSYARQFLGSMDKPDVDLIEGLSPAISIEQKTTHNNPRSTVGTVTEIYDYYRLLFARIGHAHCPNCGREIKEQSEDQIIDTILGWGEGTRLTILAPVIRGKKGEHQKIIEDAQKSGFVRARIDGLMVELDDTIKLDKQKKHTIEIVVDRIAIKEDSRKRLAESVEAALQAANGVVIVLRRVNDESEKGWHEEEVFFSQKNACPDCGISVPELQPRLFSFNNPFGACPECTGIGEKMEWDARKILPDDSLSFNEGAFPFYNPDSEWNKSLFGAVAETGGFTLDTPVKALSESQREFLWKGDDTKIMHWIYRKQSGEGFSEYKRPWLGIWADMKRRHNEAWGESQRVRMEERFMSVSECTCCHGKRLRPEALGVTVGGKNIIDLCGLSVIESLDFIEKLELTDTEKLISSQIIKEIKARLTFLKNVGLDYLTLERSAGTLSGGEAQRIRLATQIGSGLTGVMYILDEPSIGLHQRDNERLIDTLTYLRDLKNTVIVVEHDEQTLRTADWLVDIGPGAGSRGAIRRLGRSLVPLEVLLMLLSGTLLFVFAEPLVRIFSGDPEVIRLGTTVLKMVAVSEPFYGIPIVVEGMMQGAGQTRLPLLFNVTCMWGVRIAGTFVCTRLLGLGLTAAWGCMIAHNLTLFVLFSVCWLRNRWLPGTIDRKQLSDHASPG